MVHRGVTPKMIDDTYVFDPLKSTCPVPCRAYCYSGLPNTIQQDIHPNIRLAGNSPGRKFASRIFGSNNTFTYNPENKALCIYDKNDSYLTQWHTRGFQNIKLVFHYSKSVSCEISKCLHLIFSVSTGLTQFKTGHLFSHPKQNNKMSHI